VPVAASEDLRFSWHILPAGIVHGGLLALITIGSALVLWKRSLRARWAGIPLVGWIAGWLSSIPIQLYIGSTSLGVGDPGLTWQKAWRVIWPFEFSLQSVWMPFCEFGLVAVVYHIGLLLYRRRSPMGLAAHLLLATLSGILGSLWWWAGWEPWYFSLLHGPIWGSLVGFGAWKSRQFASP
jgi:hypothetical protein